MRNAAFPAVVQAPPAGEHRGLFLVGGSAISQALANRLKPAKGAMVGLVLSAGLWAVITGLIAFLRH